MLAQQKTVTEDDLNDLRSKVAIVTGGNTGIGYETVRFLAQKGAKVYMGARNEAKANAAIREIEAELPKDTSGNTEGSVHWLKLDLSDPQLAKQAGNEFLEKEKRLDILVNNAAHVSTSSHSPKLGQDSLLDIMVINHISPFEFTETLLPLLKTTATLEGSDVRIVNVSSVTHQLSKPKSFVGKDSLNKQFGDSAYGRLNTYANSKLANILHIKHLQSRLKHESIPIICIAVDPGATLTNSTKRFLNSVPLFGWFFRTVVGPVFFDSWRRGAMNPVFAAAGKDVTITRKAYEGVYLTPVAKISEPSSYANNERLQRELYETTINVLSDMGL